MNQSWKEAFDVVYQFFGRGVITTTPFTQRDDVLDYHGLVINSHNLASKEYVNGNSDHRKLVYIVEVRQKCRQLIDASSESCPIHKYGRRCLGRLCKFSSSVFTSGFLKKLFNLKLTEWICKKLSKGPDDQYRCYTILIARVDIPAITQLRYDYMGHDADQIFT